MYNHGHKHRHSLVAARTDSLDPNPNPNPSKIKMSAQEVWAARQLDLLVAGGVSILAAALNRPSPLCSRPSAMRAATMAAPSEFTDLTGRSSSTETPATQSIAASKAPAYAGPSLADLAWVFLTPSAAASSRSSSSSRAPARWSCSRSVPPPSTTPDDRLQGTTQWP
jgi:hypothetical protein